MNEGNTPRARIERVITDGQFAFDGQLVDLHNNVWLIGDDHEVVIVDAAHQPDKILDAVGERRVNAIICTHAHNDHVNSVERLREQTGAPAYLNAADKALWDNHVPNPWDVDLADGEVFRVADVELRAIHTPGHTPGSTCLYAPRLHTVFTGDTLFEGGPGATRFEYSSFQTIIKSITDRLLTLPPETVVLTGHGDSTTIGKEAADRPAWIARGY